MPQSTTMRDELLEWFSKQAPSLAPAYHGATKLLLDVGFPGRVHFIAHSFRDIADRLAFVLEPTSRAERVDYGNHTDEITKCWPKLTFTIEEGNLVGPEPIVSIGELAARRVDNLVEDHRERRTRPSNQQRLFEIAARLNPGNATANQGAVREFEKLSKWFVKWAHFPREERMHDESELVRKFTEYETILHSLFGSFFAGTEDLDDVLRETNY